MAKNKTNKKRTKPKAEGICREEKEADEQDG